MIGYNHGHIGKGVGIHVTIEVPCRTREESGAGPPFWLVFHVWRDDVEDLVIHEPASSGPCSSVLPRKPSSADSPS